MRSTGGWKKWKRSRATMTIQLPQNQCRAISRSSAAQFRESYSKLSTVEQRDLLAILELDELDFIDGSWDYYAHPHQIEPEIDTAWRTWLMLGGRGAGKTRAGAEWVRAIAASDPSARVALVGETEHDVREVMIEGVSGLLAAHLAQERPRWASSRRLVQWSNGAVAQAFSADQPDSLRGPQFSHAWCDELAKWRQAEAAFDNLQFALRLGSRPRQLITTTPRPLPLLRQLIADPMTMVTRAATRVNAKNLAPQFLASVLARYGGTRLGRQEIEGEIIEQRADALWSRAMLEDCRVAADKFTQSAQTNGAPELARIVVAVDPPASSGKRADACGLIAAGIADNGTIYVLADETSAGLSPQNWARKAVALWQRLRADCLVVEVNQGGDMVKAVIAEVDRGVPVTAVHAHRGKYLRAEPVAQLYEQERVKHAGVFPALEDEMCDFGLDGLSGGRSPDRVDALVWAVTALSFGARWQPRVRVV
jgi:phage terminase large subunit-like protein